MKAKRRALLALLLAMSMSLSFLTPGVQAAESAPEQSAQSSAEPAEETPKESESQERQEQAKQKRTSKKHTKHMRQQTSEPESEQSADAAPAPEPEQDATPPAPEPEPEQDAAPPAPEPESEKEAAPPVPEPESEKEAAPPVPEPGQPEQTASAQPKASRSKAESNPSDEESAAPPAAEPERTRKQDGELKPQEENPVAKVGQTDYTSFADALNAWTDGTTLTLLEDVSISASIEVRGGGEKTLDLNGHGITQTGQSRVLLVGNGAILNLKDSQSTVTHKYRFDNDGLAVLDKDGSLSVLGGYLTGGKEDSAQGGGVKVVNGVLRMSGGSILGNQANSGGGVYVDGGTFSMSGGAVLGNTAANNGGGVYVDATQGTAFQLSGGAVIADNKRENNNCNVYFRSGQRVALTGALTEGAHVGITMEAPGVFTARYPSGGSGQESYTNTASPEVYFFSDSADRAVTQVPDGDEAGEATLLPSAERLTVKASLEDAEYSGSAKVPTLEVLDGQKSVSAEDYTIVSYRRKDGDAWKEVSEAKDAGAYQAVVRLQREYAGTRQAAFTIAPKPVTVQWGALALTYKARAQAPAASVVGLAQGDKCSVTVDGKGTDIGTYTAKATGLSSSNYTLTGETQQAYTIAPKPVTVKWGETNLVYNGQKQRPSVTVTGVVKGDKCTITVGGRAAKAGSHTVSITKVSNPNYTLPENASIPFTIAPKPIKLKWSKTRFTYDGQAHLPTAAAVGVVTGETCSVTVTGKQTKAGSYEAKAVKLSSGNYQLPKQAKTRFTIARKRVGLKWSNTSFYADGKKHVPTATATGLVKGDKCSVIVQGAQSKPGSYTAQAVRLSNSSYQLPTTVKKRFTLSRTVRPELINFRMLLGRASTRTRHSVTLRWKRRQEADGYLIYGCKCGKNSKMKRLAEIKGNRVVKWTQKKLKSGIYYKYRVVAYRMVKGEKKPFTISPDIHTVTKGPKYTITSKVHVDKKKRSVKVGKSITIKASDSKAEPKKRMRVHRLLRFESSNKMVATVTQKGVVTGKSKGSAVIYVHSQNGKYKTVKVTVK